MAAMNAEMQAELERYKKVRAEAQKVVSTMTQLQSQLNENTMVKDSFTELKEGENVFKLVGPVLVKTELTDAMTLVDSRLALIRGQIAKSEAQIKTLGEQEEAIKDKVVAMQKRAGAAARRS